MTLSVRQYVAAKTDVNAVRFITCYLLPPPKKEVLAFLGIPLGPGEKPSPPPEQLVRKAEVDVSTPSVTWSAQGPAYLTFPSRSVYRRRERVCHFG